MLPILLSGAKRGDSPKRKGEQRETDGGKGRRKRRGRKSVMNSKRKRTGVGGGKGETGSEKHS